MTVTCSHSWDLSPKPMLSGPFLYDHKRGDRQTFHTQQKNDIPSQVKYMMTLDGVSPLPNLPVVSLERSRTECCRLRQAYRQYYLKNATSTNNLHNFLITKPCTIVSGYALSTELEAPPPSGGTTIHKYEYSDRTAQLPVELLNITTGNRDH